MKPPKLILIAGPSGSGKSTLAHHLADSLKGRGCPATVLPLDNYYHDLSHLAPESRKQTNFDEPAALEHERIVHDARTLKEGRCIDMPRYDFSTHLRLGETVPVKPEGAIIMEGLFALCYDVLNRLADLRLYVQLDEATALERRLARDTRERGRSIACVTEQYERTVRPANLRYIYPSADSADFQLSGNQTPEKQLIALDSALTMLLQNVPRHRSPRAHA